MTWLARDRMGHVAMFLDGKNDLEIEARVVAALCERDGAKWLAQDGDEGDERVLVVLSNDAHERGYRTSAPNVEDRINGAGWIVANAAEPRVLVSTRALTREERTSLRDCADCAALVGERAVHARVRGRIDSIHVYERRARSEGAAAYAYARTSRRPSQPLRSRTIAGRIARLPLEFQSSAVIIVRDDFDGSKDGAWTESPYKLDFGELVLNVVRMSFFLGLFVGGAIYGFTNSLWITLVTFAGAIAAATAIVIRGAKQTVIAARGETSHPVRVASTQVRVAEEDAEEEDEPEAEERRSSLR